MVPRLISPARAASRFALNPAFLADIVLAGMVLGPLAAPFLAAAGVFPFNTISGIIYTMGMYVCPQPAFGVPLAGSAMMAVCMRCYGTVLGLLTTRVLYAFSKGNEPWWLTQYGRRGATLMGLLILAYPFELALQILGVWRFSNPIVTLFGLITGVALGLFFVPIVYGQQTGDRGPETEETPYLRSH